jgi:hypothetical protein
MANLNLPVDMKVEADSCFPEAEGIRQVFWDPGSTYVSFSWFYSLQVLKIVVECVI